MHEKVKNVSCKQCTFKTEQESHLKLHIEIIHEGNYNFETVESCDSFYDEVIEPEIIALLNANGIGNCGSNFEDSDDIEYDDSLIEEKSSIRNLLGNSHADISDYAPIQNRSIFQEISEVNELHMNNLEFHLPESKLQRNVPRVKLILKRHWTSGDHSSQTTAPG